MADKRYSLYLANKPVATGEWLKVVDKFSQSPFAEVASATASHVESAIAATVDATRKMAELPAYKRQGILLQIFNALQERKDHFVDTLVKEAGKPLRDAKGEVGRALETFRTAAEEAVRIRGEFSSLDSSERTALFDSVWKRFPIGPVSLITPFNFPLNLVAHKIAPAIAMGCPFILKPASYTPITALLLGEILSQCDLPAGAFSILPCSREVALPLTVDDRLRLVSFTGSPTAGWDIKAKAGKKKVVLELGGNAAVIIEPDTNLDDCVTRLTVGILSNSGQSCISVQRIYIHESIYEKLKSALVQNLAAIRPGDPSSSSTAVGPLISPKDAQRLQEWVQSAVSAGARLLCGGQSNGALFPPTLLENVPKDQKLCAEEAFGPVAVLSSYTEYEEALDEVNRSRFGLQAGVFTRDIHKARLAWERLEVGGLIIGETPSFRSDPMPYGGIKESGLGREGIRFAMEDMGEIKILVTRKI